MGATYRRRLRVGSEPFGTTPPCTTSCARAHQRRIHRLATLSQISFAVVECFATWRQFAGLELALREGEDHSSFFDHTIRNHEQSHVTDRGVHLPNVASVDDEASLHQVTDSEKHDEHVPEMGTHHVHAQNNSGNKLPNDNGPTKPFLPNQSSPAEVDVDKTQSGMCGKSIECEAAVTLGLGFVLPLIWLNGFRLWSNKKKSVSTLGRISVLLFFVALIGGIVAAVILSNKDDDDKPTSSPVQLPKVDCQRCLHPDCALVTTGTAEESVRHTGSVGGSSDASGRCSAHDT